MLIFALDDKPLLLQGLKRCILEAEPSAEVLGFKGQQRFWNLWRRKNSSRMWHSWISRCRE